MKRAKLISSYNAILLNFENYDINNAVEFIKNNSAFCIEQMDTLYSNPDQMNALYIACRYGAMEVVQFFIDNGANIETRNAYGCYTDIRSIL
jgi:ankyrin repeat protein